MKVLKPVHLAIIGRVPKQQRAKKKASNRQGRVTEGLQLVQQFPKETSIVVVQATRNFDLVQITITPEPSIFCSALLRRAMLVRMLDLLLHLHSTAANFGCGLLFPLSSPHFIVPVHLGGLDGAFRTTLNATPLIRSISPMGSVSRLSHPFHLPVPRN